MIPHRIREKIRELGGHLGLQKPRPAFENLDTEPEITFVQIGELFPIKGVWFRVVDFAPGYNGSPVPSEITLKPHSLTGGGIKRLRKLNEELERRGMR